MDASVIKEFLVSLGFKLNEQDFKKFTGGIASATRQTAALGTTAVATAVTVAAAVQKIAEQYGELYYASIRAGSSVTTLRTYQAGARQIGIDADTSRGQIEGLSRAMRMNPGIGALLNNLGIRTAGREVTAIQRDLVDTLAKMPFHIAARYGELFGQDPDALLLQIKLRKEQRAAEADYAKRLEQSGLSQEVLSQKSRDFNNEVQRLKTSIGLVADQTADKWLPAMTQLVHMLTAGAEWMTKMGKETNGWSSTIFSAVTALGALRVAAMLLPGGLGRVLGIAATGGLTLGGAAVGGVAAGMLVGSTVAAGEGDKAEAARRGGFNARPGSSADLKGAQAMAYFMKQGWSKEQASGIVANLMAESKMNPGVIGDGGAAYGIAQWHPDRQANFKAFAGKDIRNSTYEEQLAFVHHELTLGREKAAGDALRRARTAGEAGSIISRQYERPANTMGEAMKRANMATGLFNNTALTPSPAEGDRSVTANNKTEITVQGSSDPQATASAVAAAQNGVNSSVVRNLSGAVQ